MKDRIARYLSWGATLLCAAYLVWGSYQFSRHVWAVTPQRWAVAHQRWAVTPVTLAAVVVLMLAVSLATSAVPGRAAAATDPMVSLRAE